MFDSSKFDRRWLLRSVAVGAAAIATSCKPEQDFQPAETDLSSSRDRRTLAQFPQKAPLILLTDRPPQLETPLHYFRKDLTPNEAHFVRWHLAGIPSSVELKTWRLKVSGKAARPLNLSFDDLQHRFEPASIVALNQCSGNSRSLFAPRVPGGQWRHGAMSNARWTGARLKEILERAGVHPKTVEVAFRGLDYSPIAGPPPFEKSLPLDIAQRDDVLVAYAMNGTPLPMLNGFPVRLIVPGWYATYWVKTLSQITLLDAPLRSFWMDKAYRIPNNTYASEAPDKLATDTVPINRIGVHSIFVVPEPGGTLRAEHPNEIQGLAQHGGQGIRSVDVSVDGGRIWNAAKLDDDLGQYSWRRWRFIWTPPRRTEYRLMVRATASNGETQQAEQWNRSGYQRSTIEHITVRAI